jgi:hypothetical protein
MTMHQRLRERDIDMANLEQGTYIVLSDSSGDFTGKAFPRIEMSEMVKNGGIDDLAVVMDCLYRKFVYHNRKLKRV